MDEATVASGRTDSKIGSLTKTAGMMGLGVAVAAAGVSVAAVKMASEFDNSMNHIRTLAGVAPGMLKPLSDSVLKLAGQVGFDPNSLADALYHVESSFASSGITAARAMDILKIAAEGAKIGGADLVDVTNALDAAIASGIPGVQNYQQAMGALLKIVGSGDMQMQDLANAFSTGILAIGKQYGATLKDIGAALATFGDNNIRGQVAATYLRMAIMDLTHQAGPGREALAGIGIQADRLAHDMQKGGLNSALIDLRNHLNAAGITGSKVGAFLIEAFTKRASAPMAILLDQFDRLQGKYGELQRGASGFGAAWAATTAQFKTRMDQLKAQGEAWAIQLGNLLIPQITKLAGALMGIVHWFGEHKKAAQQLGTVVKDFLVGSLILAAGALALIAIEAAPAILFFTGAALAIGGLVRWLESLYQHNAKFHAFVDKLVADVKQYFGEALAWLQTNGPGIWATIQDAFGKARDYATAAFRVISTVVRTVITAVNGWLADHRAQIENIFSNIAKTARSFADVFSSMFDLIVAVVQVAVNIIEDLWKRFGDHLLTHIVTALKILWSTFVRVFNGLLQVLRGALEVIKGVLDVFTGIFTGDWHKFLNGLSEIFGGVWNIIAGAFRAVWGLIVGILREGVNAISTAIGAGMALVSALWGLGWHMVETLFRNIWNRLTSQLAAGWHVIADLFAAGARLIVGLAKRAADDVTGWFKAMWDRAWKLTTQAWDNLGKFFAGLGNKIVTALGDLSGSMETIGKNIVIGIWNGIIGMGDWLKGKLEGFAKDFIPGPLQHALGIGSPSKVAADKVGQWIPAGIAKGVDDHAHLVANAMNRVAAIATGGKLNANLGVTVGQFGAARAGAMTASAAGGAVGSRGSVNLTVVVQGNVTTERQLVAAIQNGLLQLNMVTGNTRYLQYQRGTG